MFTPGEVPSGRPKRARSSAPDARVAPKGVAAIPLLPSSSASILKGKFTEPLFFLLQADRHRFFFRSEIPEMPKSVLQIVDIRTPRPLRMFSLTDATGRSPASSGCTPGVPCVLLPGCQSEIRKPVVKTIAIAMIDDDPCVRWRTRDEPVHIHCAPSDLSLRVNLPLALVHVPAMYGQSRQHVRIHTGPISLTQLDFGRLFVDFPEDLHGR